jgi:hypothetical protein
MTKSHILAEMRRTAEENGGVALGQNRFEIETGIKKYDWFGKFWARWSDAVKEAGLTPNEMNSAIPDDELWLSLATLTRKLRHFPVEPEVKLARQADRSIPSSKVFHRLGSRVERLSGLARFCERNRDFDDVAEILSATAPSATREGGKSAEAPGDVGFVYLLRSGRHHKIGHTNSVGRRERELAIQLPEKARLIHSIRRASRHIGIAASRTSALTANGSF